MCRIAAIISYDNLSLHSIERMTNSMYRGGPDGNGFYYSQENGYALGHRRLSVIDMSDAASQPMSYSHERFHITYNGEIYNYVELREELVGLGCIFTTHSDTEVILAAYTQWGESMLSRFRGMFAFIIADNQTKQLFVARDHLGIKPLYMGKRAGAFYFASEIKAFLSVNENWKPNPDWKIWFLTFGFLPAQITTLENVWSVRPGTYVKFDLTNHSYTENQWFHIEETNSETIGEDGKIEKLRILLKQSVRRHLVADVKVGVFLSGGMDSSILAALVAEEIPDGLHTLSLDFEDPYFSESVYQDLVSKQLNSSHKTYVVKKEEYVAAWDDIFKSLDQPSIDAVNSYFICRYARQEGFKVVISGLGADEFFGGYPSFERTRAVNRLNRFAVITKLIPGRLFGYPVKKVGYLKKKIAGSEYLLYRGLFTPKDVAEILKVPETYVWATISKFAPPTLLEHVQGAKQRVSVLESAVYMSGQLLKDSDIQSMWHGVEMRVPFLDSDLIKYVFSLPESNKFRPGAGKYLLKKAFASRLPEQVLERKKQGFTFPFEKWFLDIKNIHENRIISIKYYSDFLKGKINHSRLWAIYLVTNLGEKIEQKKIVAGQCTLFTFLTAFNSTGGIEKVNKLVMKCFSGEKGEDAECLSLYDFVPDIRYCTAENYTCIGGRIILYLARLFFTANNYRKVVVGHLNLSPAIWLMFIRNRNLKIILITHGIESWGIQRYFRKWLLKRADRIISVSEYTRQKLIQDSGVDQSKIFVLSNCLDPYFGAEKSYGNSYLKQRYSIEEGDRILLTVTRINENEHYKGYENVLQALSMMDKDEVKPVKYILGGKYDNSEYKRIQKLIESKSLQQHVIMPGFIDEDELTDHYSLADVFVMPSIKEGFGIVLIEAASKGVPVIAGNVDGSKEALLNGRLGTLVTPDNVDEILYAIRSSLNEPADNENVRKEERIALVQSVYSFDSYKERFLELVNGV